jgi:Negative regulator of sigma F
MQLAEGAELDAAALQHTATCPSCRSLLAPLNDFEPLDPERLSVVRSRLMGASTPVKPLWPDQALIAVFSVALLAFTAAVSYAVRMKALDVLTPWQMVVYYGVVLLSILVGASVAVGEMIPGSRWRSGAQIWILGTALALPLACVAIFHNYDTSRFVAAGVPCFSLGLVSGIAAALLVSLLLRKGFLGFPISAARVTGFLSALAGVAVLALHCPLLSVSHIVVWHFGVLLMGWLVGNLLGRRLESR